MYKHNLIINYILDNIKNGHYKIGDKILTEKELMSKFKVSRITVHNAIKDLAKADIIKRIKGKGSFVKRVNEIDDYIFELKKVTTTKEQSNKEIHELLSINLIKPYALICKKLNIDSNDRIYEIIRRMSRDNEDYGIDYSYISADLITLDELNRKEFLNNSFHSFLKNELKIKFKKISIELSIHLADNYESHLLNVEEGTPLTSWITNIIDDNDNVIACTHSVSKREVSLISFML